MTRLTLLSLLLLSACTPMLAKNIEVFNVSCSDSSTSIIRNVGGTVKGAVIEGDTTVGCLIYSDNDKVLNVTLNGQKYDHCGPTKNGITPCIKKESKPSLPKRAFQAVYCDQMQNGKCARWATPCGKLDCTMSYEKALEFAHQGCRIRYRTWPEWASAGMWKDQVVVFDGDRPFYPLDVTEDQRGSGWEVRCER